MSNVTLLQDGSQHWQFTVHARLSTTGWCVVQTPSWGLGAWRQGGANPYWGHDVEGHDVEGDLVRSPSPCHPPFSPSPGPGPFPLNCNRHSNRSLHLKVNFAVTPIGAFDRPFDLRLSTLTILNHNTINLRVVQKSEQKSPPISAENLGISTSIACGISI